MAVLVLKGYYYYYTTIVTIVLSYTDQLVQLHCSAIND